MLLLFFGLYGGFKWQAFWQSWSSGPHAVTARALGYVFSGGVDADAFLDPRRDRPPHPRPQQWLKAAMKLLAGILLLYIAVPYAYPANPRLGAWIGLTGFVLMAHFGGLQLITLAWRRAGFAAQVVMDRPMSSTSLADFWGRRWNVPFRSRMHELIFQKMVPRIGATAAMFSVFLASGIAHELVISVPARAGYGLPTLYFLLQGAGVAFERSAAGRRLGLRRGWRGWLFAFLCAAPAALFLFPDPFLFAVAVPMFRWLGALP